MGLLEKKKKNKKQQHVNNLLHLDKNRSKIRKLVAKVEKKSKHRNFP
jgi:hypothetical protein